MTEFLLAAAMIFFSLLIGYLAGDWRGYRRGVEDSIRPYNHTHHIHNEDET